MKTKLTALCILQLVFVGMSNLSFGQIDKYNQSSGKGLYFPVDTPKYGMAALLESVKLNNEFLHTKFYSDAYKNIYLINRSDSLFPVSTLDAYSKFRGFDKPQNKENRDEYSIIYVDGSKDKISQVPTYTFVRPAKNDATKGFYISSIKDARYQLQLLNSRGRKLHFEEILNQIEGLGLKLVERTRNRYGRNTINDQLFVYDADPKKILMVWHDQNQIFANFISPKGKWLLEEPVQIHKQPPCKEIYNVRQDIDTLLTTSLQSLKISKQGEYYYIGYALNTWEPGTCFNSNLPSIHLVKLNERLETVAQKQIPKDIDNENRIFSTQLSFNFELYDQGIQCFFFTSMYRASKVFCQNLSLDLKERTELIYLSNRLFQFDSDQTVATNDGTALLYTQRTSHDSKWYLQGFDADGTPKTPLNIKFPYSFRDYGNMGSPTMTFANDTFHFYIQTNRGSEAFFLDYMYTMSDYIKDLKYNIDSTNWTNDIRIIEIDSLVKLIDSIKFTESCASFHKSSLYGSKEIYVDPELKPLRYTVTKSSHSYLKKYTFYYDQKEIVRFIDVYESTSYPRKQIQITRLYCDRFGNIFWLKSQINGVTSYSSNVGDYHSEFRGGEYKTPIEDFRN